MSRSTVTTSCGYRSFFRHIYNDPLNKTDPLGLRPDDDEFDDEVPAGECGTPSTFNDGGALPLAGGGAPVVPTFPCGNPETDEGQKEFIEDLYDRIWPGWPKDFEVHPTCHAATGCHHGLVGPPPSRDIWISDAVINDADTRHLQADAAHELGHVATYELASALYPTFNVSTAQGELARILPAWREVLGTSAFASRGFSSEEHNASEYIADCLSVHWVNHPSLGHYHSCSKSVGDEIARNLGIP